MCLDVDVEHTRLRSADPIARKEHQCLECCRAILPGERYHLEVVVDWSEGMQEHKLCAHCNGTLDLGVSMTGCPKSWWFGEIHNLSADDGGFVGDILLHDLTGAQRIAMLRTVAGRRKNWRRRDGSLSPVPGTEAQLAAL